MILEWNKISSIKKWLTFGRASFIARFSEIAIALCQPSIIQGRTSNLFQGDYIRHPVLYELSSKYGMAGSDQLPLATRLDVLREHIRREIRKVCRVSLIHHWLRLLGRSLFLCTCTHDSWSTALRYLSSLSSSLSSNNNQFNVFFPFW